MATVAPRRRASPRAEISLPVALARGARHGAELVGRTHDLGPGGMRVETKRPLHDGEELAFVLALEDGSRIAGRAHVVRHHAGDLYGLRFDRLAAGALERLAAMVPPAPATGPLH